jgi:alpha-mannosidase
MALTPEWRNRIDLWHNELPRHFYRPLGAVELAGFVTRGQLGAAQALEGKFKPMPPGTRWGAKWEYGWFRGRFVLPPEARGKRIALEVDVGAESAVYVNGKAVGAVVVGWWLPDRREITLALQGRPGKTYDVLIEGYAGHGPLVVSAGPTPPGRIVVPEPGPTQATVGESTFGVWAEEVYQLWLDVQTLYELRDNLDPNALRVAEIDAGLRDFTTSVDFELPTEEMLETVRAGRERLRPLLECVNGSTAPTLFAFGHAHLDVAWLWPLEETERKCVRTFSSQLALMEEYPEYRFLQSQAHLYWLVKNRTPDLYRRIQRAVKAGQFMPEGGMWVEADTNISGGESLIRQFLYGKRFFRDEFETECEILWLPDVFGYSGALPQIMRGCGIRYFSTQKIFWAYNGGEPFPYNTFVWEGIDGTGVYTHLHNDYNSQTNPAAVIQRWNERVQKDGFSTRLLPFGWGDGGGGPTRNHLEFVRRQHDLEGAPRVQIAHPLDYFRDQEAKGFPLRYVGELYFQAHRGTYTSQARTKRGNRKSEFVLREAEMWGVAAQALKRFTFPRVQIEEAWRSVLLHQFHDIIPGTSIQRVYEETEAAHAEVIRTAQEIAGQAIARLADKSRALTVFNSLSWGRTALVALPEDFKGAADAAGNALPVQQIGGETVVEVTVPSCGWTTLYSAGGDVAALSIARKDVRGMESAPTGWMLENDLLHVRFNARGEITSIYDKETAREWAAGACNSLRMYKDVPTAWDAWDVDSMYELTPVALDEPAEIEVVASGPLVARLRVTRRIHDSTLTQKIALRRASRRIDFATVVDWQESHKLLKVAFPATVHANEAVHEIQFGHIRRPNHKSRPFDADRFEVSNHKWTALVEEGRGCAVLNDCKYGVNVVGNSINLTLLRAPLAPDATADKGRQEFTYAFYAWNGAFADCDLVREGYDLNVPVLTAPGAAGERSLFALDAPNVVIETVKPAEDGSKDIVVRLYEAKRTATRCTLTTTLPVKSAAQTDMLENDQAALPCDNGQVALDFRAFEIKTVRLRMAA